MVCFILPCSLLADGEAASALVIPEKRGKGPFNECLSENYFGSLSAPLKLTELKLLDDNLVRVRYSYLTTSGRRAATGGLTFGRRASLGDSLLRE